MKNRKTGKKYFATILAAVLSVACIAPVAAYAQETEYYLVSAEESSQSQGNLTYASGVTKEMCTASFWADRSVLGADRVLASAEDIAAYNKSGYDSSGTAIYGIEKKTETYAAKNRLGVVPTGTYYLNGEKIDNTAYFQRLTDAYNETCLQGQQKTGWGIAVKNTSLKAWPESDILTSSEDSTEDQMQTSSLIVNEPFVIQQECVVDGVKYYWGYTDNCTGWVKAEDLALCDSKQEWLDAWNFDLDGKDFLVVTQDKLVLESSISNSYSSDVQLDMGCALRLVPEEQWSAEISKLAERGTWNNYVVYLPVRAEDGSLEEEPALISQHYSVSIGYLPLTERNILNAAFSCLGDRYGWGAMLKALDCSAYSRNLYRCFGYVLPRNTTGQPKVAGYTTDLSAMTDEEKTEALASVPIGSLLYFSGHCMVYVGMVDGTPYCISATGSLADSGDDDQVESMYSVILNPLTVKRKNGNTWLHELTAMVTFTDLRVGDLVAADSLNYKWTKTFLYDGKDHFPEITITNSNGDQVEASNYSLNYPDQSSAVGTYSCELAFNGNYTGSKVLDYMIVPGQAEISSVSRKAEKMTVKLKKKASALGGSYYQIRYRVKGSEDWTYTSTDQRSKVITGLCTGKKYQVKARVCFETEDWEYYGKWSTVKTTTTK